jgi:hypothetical protein
MVNALVFRAKEYKAMRKLLRKARANPIPFAQMKMRAHLHALDPESYNPIGNQLFVEIPHGYRVAYSVEEGRENVPCHHLSVTGPNPMPHPDAVAFLAEVCGIPLSLMDCLVFTEVIGRHASGEEHVAINVICPMSGDMSDLFPEKKKQAHVLQHYRRVLH